MVKKIDPVDWDKWEDHVSETERWDEYDEYDPNRLRQDYDRCQGHTRIEASVTVGSLVRIFRKLFDKRRAK